AATAKPRQGTALGPRAHAAQRALAGLRNGPQAAIPIGRVGCFTSAPAERVVGRREAPRAAAEFERGAGPQGGDAAFVSRPVHLVPAAAATRGPDAAGEALLQLRVVALLYLGAHLGDPFAARVHARQRVEHVVQLRLDHVDHRVVAEAGVRPD